MRDASSGLGGASIHSSRAEGAAGPVEAVGVTAGTVDVACWFIGGGAGPISESESESESDWVGRV